MARQPVTRLAFLCCLVFLAVGCNRNEVKPAADPPSKTLLEARRGFSTTLTRQKFMGEVPDDPPRGLFNLIRYKAPLGENAAYVSPSPDDGKRHPGIIWIFGDSSNSIGYRAWIPGTLENDQSASAFRDAGIIMMYPSLRGGSDNAGAMEGFYGEVDDVLAATDYLASLDYVDPQRIYLGGHSTGGTLALLVSEVTDRFRAVFSFGPVDDVRGYGSEVLPFDVTDKKEGDLRAPILWLHGIQSPTFVFEGTVPKGNLDCLSSMSDANQNSFVHFHPVKNADRFSVLAPITKLVAEKILADTETKCNLSFSDDEIQNAVSSF
ncbi:MAG: prolyl oligopeptidase family serine peptidase [Planctomycetes bacterium]|nr:prolyl oligopeptidase family serine peptidase [Planctomycetota bacterium]